MKFEKNYICHYAPHGSLQSSVGQGPLLMLLQAPEFTRTWPLASFKTKEISNEVRRFRLVTVRLYEVLSNLMWETEVASLAR